MSVTLVWDRIVSSGYSGSWQGQPAGYSSQGTTTTFGSEGGLTLIPGQSGGNTGGPPGYIAQEQIRGVSIYGLVLQEGASDPTIFAQAISYLPAYGTTYVFPGVGTGYVSAIDFEPVDREKTFLYARVHYTMILQGTGSIPWSISEIPQTSIIQTFACFDGSIASTVRYSASATSSGDPGPGDVASGVDEKAAATPRVILTRVLKASALMLGQQWGQIKGTFAALEGLTNAVVWGSEAPESYLYLGAANRTADRGLTYNVELTFAQKKPNWRNVVAYYNFWGNHPAHSDTEQQVRAQQQAGPDAPVIYGNGVSLIQVQGTGDFSVFPFTPDTY